MDIVMMVALSVLQSPSVLFYERNEISHFDLERHDEITIASAMRFVRGEGPAEASQVRSVLFVVPAADYLAIGRD